MTMLLEQLGTLNDLLPSGERNVMDLMANHSSEVEVFSSEKYCIILTEIVRKFGENSNGNIDHEIMRFCGMTDNSNIILETMNVLSDIENLRKSSKYIATILEKLLDDETYLMTCFVRLSKASLNIDFDSFIHQIINLPEKIANRLHSNFPKLFNLTTFNSIISINAIKAFYTICRINEEEQSTIYDVDFLAKLISKCWSNFKDEKSTISDCLKVLSILSVKHKCYQNEAKKLMMKLNRQTTEIIAIIMFSDFHIPNRISSMIGSVWKENCHWIFVLTKKFPFLSYSDNDKIIENVTFFLRTEDDSITQKLTRDLIEIWCTKSHINDIPFEHHFYVTKFLVLMVKYLQKPEEHINFIRQNLYQGTQKHLESSDMRIKVLGMITTETILGILDSGLKDDEKLKFDYSEYKTESLQKIVDVIRDFPYKARISFTEPQDYKEDEIEMLMERLEKRNQNDSTTILSNLSDETKLISLTTQQNIMTIENDDKRPAEISQELDSDDDEFETYIDPDDLPIRNDSKQPRYLLDVIKAFSSKECLEDSEMFELSMKFSSDIITQQLKNHHSDIAIDLLTIFIKLNQTIYVDNFDELRLKILVSICVIYPKECANYLCSEFNTETTKYSMYERMLMLDTIAETAKKLSQLEIPKVEEYSDVNSTRNTSKNKLMIKLNRELENRNKTDAQKIIRLRLLAKTRKIASRTKPPIGGVNKFSEIAGWFFFPLVNGFGRKRIIFKSGACLKDDYEMSLMMKFLHTISVIMLCSENSIISPKMAKEIFNLSVFLRYHDESRVRLAVLHMVSTVILAVSKQILQRDFYNEINEFMNHLSLIVKSGVVSYEPDKECREFAQQLIGMFIEVLKSE